MSTIHSTIHSPPGPPVSLGRSQRPRRQLSDGALVFLGSANILHGGQWHVRHSIASILRGGFVRFFPDDDRLPRIPLSDASGVILAPSSLIAEPAGVWRNVDRWLRRLRLPFAFLNLSLVDSPVLPKIRALLPRARFCFVRDHASRDLLDRHPAVAVHPDVAWCRPYAPSEPPPPPQFDVALSLTPTLVAPSSFADWVDALRPFTVCSFPLDFTRQADLDALALNFTPLRRDFSIEPLLRSRVLLAAEYHAVLFAMQLGKPFVALNVDEATRRLVDDAGLHDCLLESPDPQHVAPKLRWVLENEPRLLDLIAAHAAIQLDRAAILEAELRGRCGPVDSPAA